MSNPATTLRSQRLLPFPPEKVFAAFANPETLATWWGPAGFSNEFDAFDFRPGGRWIFTMIGPDGRRYPNNNLFVAIEPAREITLRHDGPPYFTAVFRLTPHAGGTLLDRAQTFDDPAVCEAVRHICEPANERTIDRLAAALGSGISS